MSNRDDRLRQFFTNVFEEDLSIGEVKADLMFLGIDVKPGISRVKAMFGEIEKDNRPSWVRQAQAKRSEIGQALSGRKDAVRKKYDIPKILKDLKAGKGGLPFAEKANAFFRNQKWEDLTERDLESFLEDCEALEVLNKDNRKK